MFKSLFKAAFLLSNLNMGGSQSNIIAKHTEKSNPTILGMNSQQSETHGLPSN